MNVDAYDANPDAIRFLFHLMERINDVPEIKLSVNIVPQGLFVGTETDMQDFARIPNSLYHFAVSFKALNEFVQSDTFPNKNVYDLTNLAQILPKINEFYNDKQK